MPVKSTHLPFNTHVVRVEDLNFRNARLTEQIERRALDFASAKGVVKGYLGELEVGAVGTTAIIATGAAWIQGKRPQLEDSKEMLLPPDSSSIIWIAYAQVASPDPGAIRYDDEGNPHTVWWLDGYEVGLTPAAQWLDPPDKLALARADVAGAQAVITDYRVYLAARLPLGAAVVETNSIKDAAVTTSKLAAESVTTTKLGAEAVTADKLGAASVTTEKLRDGAVDFDKLADGAAGFQKLAEGGIGGSKIATAAVSESKLASGTGPVILFSSLGEETRASYSVFSIPDPPVDQLGNRLPIAPSSIAYKLGGFCPHPASVGPIRSLKLDYAYEAPSADPASLTVWLCAWLYSDPPDRGDPDSANAKMFRTSTVHTQGNGIGSLLLPVHLLGAGRLVWGVCLKGGSGENDGAIFNVLAWADR